MITKKFIIDVYGKFKMLGFDIGDDYKQNNFKMDWQYFFKEVIKLLNQAANFNETAKILSIALWCIKNYKKIDYMFYKHWYEWHQIKRDNVVHTQMIKALSPAAIKKQFVISNIFQNGQIIGTITGLALEKPAHILKDQKYYFLNTPKKTACIVAKSSEARLYDIQTKELLAEVGLDIKGQIVLGKNKLPFEFVTFNQIDYAFDKEYLSTLKKGRTPDIDKAIASIAWDSLSPKNFKYGLAVLTPINLKSTQISEHLFLISAATFLVLNKQLKIIKFAESHNRYLTDKQKRQKEISIRKLMSRKNKSEKTPPPFVHLIETKSENQKSKDKKGIK